MSCRDRGWLKSSTKCSQFRNPNTSSALMKMVFLGFPYCPVAPQCSSEDTQHLCHIQTYRQQGSPASFDQVKIRIHLIRSINGNIKL